MRRDKLSNAAAAVVLSSLSFAVTDYCRCTRVGVFLGAVRRERDTPIWKLEPFAPIPLLRQRRYKPPVRMIKLAEERDPYKWMHSA